MNRDSVLPRSVLRATLASALGVAYLVVVAYVFGYRWGFRGLLFTGIVLTGILSGIGSISFTSERGWRMSLVAAVVAALMLTGGGLLAAYADWHGPSTKAELEAMRQQVRNGSFLPGIPVDIPFDAATGTIPTSQSLQGIIHDGQLEKIDRMSYIDLCRLHRRAYFWELLAVGVGAVLAAGAIAYAPYDRW